MARQSVSSIINVFCVVSLSFAKLSLDINSASLSYFQQNNHTRACSVAYSNMYIYHLFAHNYMYNTRDGEGKKNAQLITRLSYRLKLPTDIRLTGVRRITQLQHI